MNVRPNILARHARFPPVDVLAQTATRTAFLIVPPPVLAYDASTPDAADNHINSQITCLQRRVRVQSLCLGCVLRSGATVNVTTLAHRPSGGTGVSELRPPRDSAVRALPTLRHWA